MSNNIENAVAIAIFSTIAIGISIAEAIFQLLRDCYRSFPIIAIAKKIPKLFHMASFLSSVVTASKSEHEWC